MILIAYIRKYDLDAPEFEAVKLTRHKSSPDVVDSCLNFDMRKTTIFPHCKYVYYRHCFPDMEKIQSPPTLTSLFSGVILIMI